MPIFKPTVETKSIKNIASWLIKNGIMYLTDIMEFQWTYGIQQYTLSICADSLLRIKPENRPCHQNCTTAVSMWKWKAGWPSSRQQYIHSC